ncbi:AP2/ERF transcription factor SNZ [Quillaja saponaria]|uniref:AP2/ERF transcription factor SNZ n=1 Tax=Quillaja saponaria TaxID=32244 RepID=A0AAD7L3V3_QUISA|nr:AP2/ERF transcription factor SNZ [Quillaja saponaria]
MEPISEAPPLPDLILSLEQATAMARQLATTTDPTHLLQLYTSLYHANHHLSTFLSKTQFPNPVLPPPPPAENSFSSATGAAGDDKGNEPMQIGEDEEVEVEYNSKGTIEKVEEKMRDCFIKNKRPKRRLSPSTAAVVEERRLFDDGFVGGAKDFDPHATRLRALDLVYQFHG